MEINEVTYKNELSLDNNNNIIESETQERIDILLDAKENLLTAIELIRYAIHNTATENRVERYLVADLEMAISKETSWVAHNECNIESLIDELRKKNKNENGKRNC